MAQLKKSLDFDSTAIDHLHLALYSFQVSFKVCNFFYRTTQNHLHFNEGILHVQYPQHQLPHSVKSFRFEIPGRSHYSITIS